MSGERWGGAGAGHKNRQFFFFFLVERKVCFILEAGNLGAGSYPKADSPPPATPSDEQWTRAFIDRGRGLHAETAQLALAVMLTLVIGGLISEIGRASCRERV